MILILQALFPKQKIWWRQYLTTVQIVQFMIDMTTSFLYPYFIYTGVTCQGTMRAWFVANFTGFSFFLLFVQLYRREYINKKNPASEPKKDN